MAADPSYPLLPVASIACSALLLLVLISRTILQSWNLGVTILSFFLFLHTLIVGIDTIVWSDDYEVKHVLYCDITTRVKMFATLVRPACSLLITRRLSKIVSARSVTSASEREKRVDLCIELGMGLVFPGIVVGVFCSLTLPLYIVQGSRFQIYEGFGCQSAVNVDVVELLLIESWGLTLPLISIVLYSRIIWEFYRNGRETNRFLKSDSLVARDIYLRIIVLGCADIFFTLPVGAAQMIIAVNYGLHFIHRLPFYSGWSSGHSAASSAPEIFPFSETSSWALSTAYISSWAPVALGYIVILLFGFTPKARASYRHAYLQVLQLLPCGHRKRPPSHPVEMDFAEASSTEVCDECCKRH
ncbi:GPCR fungal pheromone mating factor [Vararia minispora EC-137]|uniref:GPCR fungal pheromone mating factor n=1 Tax=Vararia minispora EC-137 TaxID=1314806 RepID=A0ACB8QIY7_9AGAM|nr:GPCR fungal pheromone mating factor [Vararia minispora EC-137]